MEQHQTPTNRAIEKRTLALAIGTRNRPVMLADCLSSVIAMRVPSRYDLAIVVVDNSETREMRQTNRRVIDTALKNKVFTLLKEDRIGISFSRNRGIEFAVDCEADALIIIDDDQTVPPDWLEVMTRVWREEGADAVKSSCRWILEGEGRYREYFELREQETGPDGRLRNWPLLATNGVLVDRKLFTDWGLRFDTAFALTGGSDTDFFFRSHSRGGKHVLTSETQACEICPVSKQTLRWIFRREFRIGAVLAVIAQRNRNRAWAFALASRKVLKFSMAALALIALRRQSLYCQLRAARSVGLCWGYLGGKVVEYKQVVGY